MSLEIISSLEFDLFFRLDVLFEGTRIETIVGSGTFDVEEVSDGVLATEVLLCDDAVVLDEDGLINVFCRGRV